MRSLFMLQALILMIQMCNISVMAGQPISILRKQVMLVHLHSMGCREPFIQMDQWAHLLLQVYLIMPMGS